MHVSEIINTKENSYVCKFVSVYLRMSKDVSYGFFWGGERGMNHMHREQLNFSVLLVRKALTFCVKAL